MKKIAIAVFAIGAVVLVSGCAKKGTENSNQGSGKKETAKEETGGVINSIKDAIGLGKKMECSYTYKEGNESFTTKTYIEGKKYKGESEAMGKKQMMVFDGETMYMWNPEDKKGTKWEQKCIEELNKDNKKEDSSAPKPTEEDIKDASEAFADAMDVKCTPVDSIDFSVPSDIVFSDMCEQLKAMQEKFKDMEKNLPKGANIPDGVSSGTEPQL